MSSADADIVSAVRAQFGDAPPAQLGVAVSGGGDSVALLHILTRCFDSDTCRLRAVTVDHGLRPESAEEALAVRDFACSLGVAHDVLHWEGWDGQGNLQDHARRARYGLIGDWARAAGIGTVAFGHTLDDQAETVLMRLARASGVTGLSGMPVRRETDGITVLRPVLGLSRHALRDYLTRNRIGWVDDPSNEDPRFDRVKARQALAALAPLGVTATCLAAVADHMAQAREALDRYSFLAARDLARVDGGDVVLDAERFHALPEEIARRLLVGAIVWIGGAGYPPRGGAVGDALVTLRRGVSTVLAGCRILHRGRRIWICREYAVVRELHGALTEIWDHRWRLSGGSDKDAEIRPLGPQGLVLCPSWRDTGRPGEALVATPAVWSGQELIAAPLAGEPNGWRAELLGGSEGFFTSLLSH